MSKMASVLLAMIVVDTAYGEIATNEAVAWGQPVQNVALSLRLAMKEDDQSTARTEFDSASDIAVRLVATNLGPDTVLLKDLRGQFTSWRIALFDSRGIPVRKTPAGLEQDWVASRNSMPMISGSSYEVPPCEERVIFLRWLDKYFKIEQPGTYHLIMMRNICESWNDGILISNLVEFRIVAKKDTRSSDQEKDRGSPVWPSIRSKP